MRKAFLVGAVATVAALATSAYAGEKTRFGTDASEWSSLTAVTATQSPVGGSGQVNGDFVTGERNGVQIAIRTQRRFLQNVDPIPNVRDGQTAVYFADTGTSDAQGRATWNFDFHVDLRDAKGVMKGKTLADYDFTLETDIALDLDGNPVVLDLPSTFALGDGGDLVLFQRSHNPKFGNPTFDADAEGTYTFVLTLTPKTFNGAPISVTMVVIVSDPA